MNARNNATSDLHEVTLRGWAFRHESMMPRMTGDGKPCGNHTDPLPKTRVMSFFAVAVSAIPTSSILEMTAACKPSVGGSNSFCLTTIPIMEA